MTKTTLPSVKLFQKQIAGKAGKFFVGRIDFPCGYDSRCPQQIPLADQRHNVCVFILHLKIIASLPFAATALSLLKDTTVNPVAFAKLSVTALKSAELSCATEYFCITSLSPSIKISNGVPTLILKICLISLGMTTRPSSSTLLVIPVSFIKTPYENYSFYV